MLLKVFDVAYTIESDGYEREQPVVHLFGRDPQCRRHHVEVDGFAPYFCVCESDLLERAEALGSDDRIVDTTTTDSRGNDEESLRGERLTRTVCQTPRDVGDVRDAFGDHYEADIPFTVRFLIDQDIYQWARLPDEAVDTRVDVSSVESADGAEDVPDQWVPPRVCTVDIEVAQEAGGPSVVSKEGTELAASPITAITAHDSYTDQYHSWVLPHTTWDEEDVAAARRVATDADVSVTVDVVPSVRETAVPIQFVTFVEEYDPDVLTGWNANAFDTPYVVNFLHQRDEQAVHDLAPVGWVSEMDGDGKWINRDLSGRVLMDLLAAWEKTLIHEPDSKRLADVAEAEVDGIGKLDVDDIDEVWANDPARFVEYNLRDVRAAVKINEESKEDVRII